MQSFVRFWPSIFFVTVDLFEKNLLRIFVWWLPWIYEITLLSIIIGRLGIILYPVNLEILRNDHYSVNKINNASDQSYDLFIFHFIIQFSCKNSIMNFKKIYISKSPYTKTSKIKKSIDVQKYYEGQFCIPSIMKDVATSIRSIGN